MALTELVQLAQGILNQTLENSTPNQLSNGGAKAANGNANTQHPSVDAFVPSSFNAAQDAGTFQVLQVSLFTAAANLLLAQPAATQSTAATGTQTTDAPVAATDVNAPLAELSNLNASLTMLGLSPADITVIDRLAQLVRDFNPAAFNDIINQLETLARDTTPQTAAPPTTATNQPVANTGAAGSFALQEVSVEFGSVNSTERPGNGRHLGNGGTRFSDFQVQTVTLTLNNTSTGATTQIKTPQTADQQTTVAKAAAAAA
jgi:hypothetical protein